MRPCTIYYIVVKDNIVNEPKKGNEMEGLVMALLCCIASAFILAVIGLFGLTMYSVVVVLFHNIKHKGDKK